MKLVDLERTKEHVVYVNFDNVDTIKYSENFGVAPCYQVTVGKKQYHVYESEGEAYDKITKWIKQNLEEMQ